MPLYEYKCDSCGQVFEVMQRFSDAPLQQHENCGGALRRLVSAPALQFKGSGWYVNDYARAGGKSASEGGDKSKEKSESKPADSSSSSTGSTPSTTPATTTSTDKK